MEVEAGMPPAEYRWPYPPKTLLAQDERRRNQEPMRFPNHLPFPCNSRRLSGTFTQKPRSDASYSTWRARTRHSLRVEWESRDFLANTKLIGMVKSGTQ